jgi:hypothetical protein
MRIISLKTPLHSFARKLLLLLIFIMLTALFSRAVNAVSLSPSSGNYGVGSTITFSIVTSSVPASSLAVQVRINVPVGGTITAYTDPAGAGWLPGLPGGCNGTAKFSVSNLCVDLTKSTDITNGESLGTFTVRFDSAGTYNIARGSDNGYLSGSTVIPQTGTVSTINVLTSLPSTSIFDNFSGISAIIFGVTLIIGGIFLKNRVGKSGFYK